MKLVSNFYDYYDKSLAYGIDDDIYFKRISSIENIYDECLYPFLQKNSLRVTSFSTIDITPVIIGFCGKLYLGLTLSYIDISTSKLFKKTFYNEDNCKKYLIHIIEDIKNNSKDLRFYKDVDLKIILSDMNSFFIGIKRGYNRSVFDRVDYYEKLEKFLTNLFIYYNIPYFAVKSIEVKAYDNKLNYELIKLPTLKEYEFIKVKDPIQAFQEISMYLGGVLSRPVNPMIEISNKDQAIKKGFGHKYAFRKEPTKKKGKKGKKGK